MPITLVNKFNHLGYDVEIHKIESDPLVRIIDPRATTIKYVSFKYYEWSAKVGEMDFRSSHFNSVHFRDYWCKEIKSEKECCKEAKEGIQDYLH